MQPVRQYNQTRQLQKSKYLIKNQAQLLTMSQIKLKTKVTIDIQQEGNLDRKLLAPPSLPVQRLRRLLMSQISHKASSLPLPATSLQPLQRLLQ